MILKNVTKKTTVVLILAVIAVAVDLFFALSLLTGNSSSSIEMGIYFLLSLIPIFILVVIDRILIQKYGNQKVNKVQFSILILILFLWFMGEIQ
ncbi:hypothetical protein SAMN06265346_102158 [Flavobacterium hercynium]|nr:hypothetical protein SAMN06265346_102158 [Flavobacterium hercynium]